jgi:hypothetical protein
MPSRDYRYLCYDHEGGLHGPREFSATSDEDAISQISAKHPHDLCEIWQERRLVATIGRSTLDRAINSSRHTLATARRTLHETAALVRGSADSPSA